MVKKIIFQDSFLISGIMCYVGCGATIQSGCAKGLQECIKKELLPLSAQLVMDAEPQALGVHRIYITVTEDSPTRSQDKYDDIAIAAQFKNSVSATGFDIEEQLNGDSKKNASKSKANWINIILNLLAIGVITTLSLVFPPSILLTAGLTTLSFLTTLFTARNYLFDFLKSLRTMKLANMNTTVTLGWFLSLAHTLYHVIYMPLASSFSMMFMCFIMPVMLITIINGMDEIKRHILNKAKKMHLRGMSMLFPQMAETYPCYELSQAEQDLFSQPIECILYPDSCPDEFSRTLDQIMTRNQVTMEPKNSLKKGMIIKINRGECFPVDCNLIHGNTVVDSSLLTGESQQTKRCPDFIPAGAINLGEPVTVYASKDAYSSTINQLLFRSNRAKDDKPQKPNHTFSYVYTSLIGVGLLAALIIPLSLGILTIPLLLQNITGILFAVCPCTMVIAHQLPKLLNLHQRNRNGIMIRDEQRCEQTHKIHTVVFDKTGTLTTGNSQVESFEGISPSLWERIYLLEKNYGAEHPLAKAITQYYAKKIARKGIIRDVEDVSYDPTHRGISAMVQAKKIHLGNAEYLKQFGIDLPPPNDSKMNAGFTPVYVAEDSTYQGIIYIKHEIRKNILSALTRLKREGKKLIMLTGDSRAAALGFNQQNGSIFEEENIHAGQNPGDKEEFLQQLMTSKASNLYLMSELPKSPAQYKNSYLFIQKNGTQELFYITTDGEYEKATIIDFNLFEEKIKAIKKKDETQLHLNAKQIQEIVTANGGHIPTNNVSPKGIWFIGDGLNDAPCAKMVTEQGGVSCAMTSKDKTSFFTDISLNGSLDYLFEHNTLNRFLKKNVRQNQGLLLYGALSFLAFIVSFSVAGIAVSPIIPLLIMASTTLFVLFNSFRMPLKIDASLDPNASWSKQLFASDASLGLLVSASLLLVSSLLISTIATGGLALPVITFTAGAVAAISSVCLIAAAALTSLFVLLMATYFCVDKSKKEPKDEHAELTADAASKPNKRPTLDMSLEPQKQSAPSSFWSCCAPKEPRDDKVQVQQSTCAI